MRIKKHTYTHTDCAGMRWRFEGARPVSELADQVMAAALARPHGPFKRLNKKGKR